MKKAWRYIGKGATSLHRRRCSIASVGFTGAKGVCSSRAICIRLAEEIYRRQGDGDRRASAVVALGHIYQEQARFDLALTLYQQHPSHPAEIATQFDNIGNVQLYRGQLDSALTAYRRALDIYARHDHPRGRAVHASKMGQVLSKLRRFEEALQAHRDALGLYREFDLYMEGGAELDFIGRVYVAQDRLPEALEAFQDALHVFTQAGSRQGEAAQLDNVGNTYFERGELDKALKAFGDALHVFRLLGHRRGEAQSLGNMGCCIGARVRRWRYLII